MFNNFPSLRVGKKSTLRIVLKILIHEFETDGGIGKLIIYKNIFKQDKSLLEQEF